MSLFLQKLKHKRQIETYFSNLVSNNSLPPVLLPTVPVISSLNKSY